MIWLSILGYLVDVWILATYAHLSRTGRARPFHWANGIGFVPLVAIEIITGAYPVVPLTLTFGIIGLVGVWQAKS